MNQKLTTLCDALTKDLIQNVLPYWMNKMPDSTYGGFYGRRNGLDVIEERADKGIILNARILWTFSHAVNVLSKTNLVNEATIQSYRLTADRAYVYINHYFLDRSSGGVYWMVDFEGKPVNTKKQVYAQAFYIYALSEYFMATGKREALDQAIALFDLIEKYSFDTRYKGYLEAFDKDWNLLEDLRLSEKDANEKKTMNTHLHVLEAYTNLYRCWKDERLATQLKNLIIVFNEIIIDKSFHFQLFFDEQWNVRPHPASYGHDIEGSWLLYEAAEVTGDMELIKKAGATALTMVNQTIQEALDSDGGLMYEGSAGVITIGNKDWWPQTETIVGCINAWQLSGEERYLDVALKVWNFIDAKLIDKVHGEWHWGVTREGQLFNEDKAGPWKCPYHNGRAALEIYKRANT
jgi:cellobiose epimerase